MSGLVRRVVATIKGWWSRLSTAVLSAGHRVVRVVRTVAVRVVGAASAALVAIRERHRERTARDPSYRTAIATGLSALLVTITPQPAVAAALAVLVSEHLGTARAATRATTYDEYDDDEDGYPSYGTSATRPYQRPGAPQRLWDNPSM